MASLSTNEDTSGNSPSPNLSIISCHQIQCDCNFQGQNFIQRYFLSPTQVPVQTETCLKAKEWVKSLNFPKNAVEVYQSILNSHLDLDEFNNSIRQIELDINRTYPDEAYFNSKPGEDALRRVLAAFCKYDSCLGYVQGMNYIVAALLWHCAEADAFWIFVGMMEKYELRDTYLPKFPGLSKHCQIIQLILFEHLPKLHRHFSEFDVQCKMYATEWVFSLFGSVIPACEMISILDNFFKQGWIFFYKFVVYILKSLENQLLEARELGEIIVLLKICHRSQNEWKDFLPHMFQRRGSVNWDSILSNVEGINLDAGYIRHLHMSFDIEKIQFVQKKF